MEVKFTASDVRELLSDYFTKRDGIESKMTISTKISYDRYDNETSYTEIKLKRKIIILGKEKIATVTITEDEIKEILKDILEEAGYKVQYVELDNGINYVSEGYGMGERTVSKPYFNGMTVNMKKNEKVKVK